MSNELYVEHEASDATEQATPKFDDIDLEPLAPARAAEGTRDNVVLPPLPESWPEPKLPPLPNARMRATLPPPRRAMGTAGMGHPIVTPPPAPPSVIVDAPQLTEADIATEYYEKPTVEPFVKRSTLALLGGTALVIITCIAVRVGGSSDGDRVAAKAAATPVEVDRGEKNEPTKPAEKKDLAPSENSGSVATASSLPSASAAPTSTVEPIAPSAHADAEAAAVVAAEAVASPAPVRHPQVASPAPVEKPAPAAKPAPVAKAATVEKPAPVAKAAAVEKPAPVAKAATPAHAPVPKAVAALAPPAPSGPPGILAISTKPPCEIYVDGKSTHLSTPQKALKLPPGKHEIVLVNPALKIRETRQIQIASSAQTKLVLDLQHK